MRYPVYIPNAVLRAIESHVADAVKKAESAYSSAKREEDALTGNVCGLLKTYGERAIEVVDDNRPGYWRWSIDYTKFGSKGKGAPESVLGADGLFELRVRGAEGQQKTALFQAKNDWTIDRKLVGQCLQLSTWREAAFVINYTPLQYAAYFLDDVIASRGSQKEAGPGTPLANWLVEQFIRCRVGHRELYYDLEREVLTWRHLSQSGIESWNARRVSVKFQPKHVVTIEVTPPFRDSRGVKSIKPSEVHGYRLEYEAEDLFALEGSFDPQTLKSRRDQLLHVYHSDRHPKLGARLQQLADTRTAEINQAYQELTGQMVKRDRQEPAPSDRASPGSLGEAEKDPLVDLLKPDQNARVKVRRRSTRSTK